MKKTPLAFIGAGNMARSLIGGLIADGWDPASISVSDPDPDQLAAVGRLFGTRSAKDNTSAVEQSELVVLAVKPQVMHDVACELAATVQARHPLVISIAAGICSNDLERWLGGNCALVRCMPNTPALVQSGATALFANSAASDDQKALAESILRAVGLTLWIEDESLLDAVTALSGSGPAYFFLVIEALQEAGQSLGLDDKTARLLAVQTAFGAAKMALESRDDAATLRQKVTSPGGTTEKALAVLEEGGLRTLFNDALKAARDRSRELAKQFGEKS
ncbi:pyrroline-5-carboxylate reductase [Thiogranum longum]|uniref:Pyrroline-5-carboxylate reductase n=1 Tax=Thiogranum longum TaxID=1537524 RepID=A0A4R1HAI6_9GAMM|nr:pyrroline-5-carboxylate reductase [Thiogranum longum]TCK17130.1 pyrroline-5-carboxylate reductase [Thiogranum longum]